MSTSIDPGRVLVGGFDGTSLPAELERRLAEGELAGVILFRRNLVDVAQCRALCASIHAACARGGQRAPLLAIDQEGGRVKRLDAPILPLPPMRALGALDDVAFTERAHRALGLQLAALGINLDFTPVADVDSNPANPVIGDRSFGRDPELVARHVAAAVRGMQSAGVAACAKHFPGHGDTSVDSHLALPRVSHPRERLESVELPPFRAAVRVSVASMMSAHVVYDALDAGVTATLSRRVLVDLLRGELGYGGVLFSDDLHMRAIADDLGVSEASIASLRAGCDVLLICKDPDAQHAARLALRDACAKDPELAARLAQSAARVDAMRDAWPSRVAEAEALNARLAEPSVLEVQDELRKRV